MRQWDSKSLEKLLNVQEIDIKIRAVEEAVDEINLRSMREDPSLNNMKTELVQLGESLEGTRAQQEMYRNTLEDIRTAIKGLAATRSGSFKPRTKSSTEALKLEEEKLGVLVEETEEQIQKLRREHDGVEKKINSRSHEVKAFQQAPEADLKKLKNRLRALEKQREEAVKGIPSLLLKKYERLKTSRSGVGLTIMRDGVCRVCRMQMPTGVRFRLLKGEPIASCPACGRMVARVENPMLEKEEARRVAAEKEEARNIAEAKKAADKKAADKKKAIEKKAADKKKAVEKKAADKKKVAEKKVAEKKKKVVEKKKSVSKKPSVKKPAAKKPVGKKPAAKKPAAKPAAKKPAAKKPAAKKPTDTKKLSKKPASKKPASKSRTAAKTKTAKKK